MSSISDTSPEAERIWIQAFRDLSPGRKWLILGEMFRDAKALHAAGVRFRNPTASDDQIHAKWMQSHFGNGIPLPKRRPSMNPAMENLRSLREVLDVFSSLRIPYALGGSMASSVFGIDRYTRDADITVEPFPGLESEFASKYGPDYYLSVKAVQEAVRDRSSFNIIHTSTGFKVDVFVRKEDGFEKSAMARRASLDLPDLPGQVIFFHSPEDVILFKLRWFRLGNEASEQQLSDVVGVLKIQGDKLDFNYLETWAKELKVDDLLTRVRQEPGS